MDLTTLLAVLLSYQLGTTQPPIAYQFFQWDAVHPQKIHTLTIDITNPNVTFQSGLAYGQLFGFETTSQIIQHYGGLGGVNGTFFGPYGQPLGFLLQQGQYLSLPIETTPIFAWDREGDVYVGDLTTHFLMEAGGQEWYIHGFNRSPLPNERILFTPEYGATTRIDRPARNYIFKGDEVIDIRITQEPLSIPRDGKVVTELLPPPIPQSIFAKGDRPKPILRKTPDISLWEGFQSGGWIVKGGENVAKPYEPFMGYTTQREPRTAIGKTKEGKILLCVVDGRQKGWSGGFNGYELGEFLKDQNCMDAVYLDGGASSTMVFQGQVINRPSQQRRERRVGHALFFSPHEKYFIN
ncbi:MAG: phosphodiester glycosidase family protein [Epulopiscium sp.]|nr:phosphodiester glycosidase family protein [Candidatus Epulonipiscium sp.]